MTEKRSLGSINPVTLRSLGSPANSAEPDNLASGTTTSNFAERPPTSRDLAKANTTVLMSSLASSSGTEGLAVTLPRKSL
ncbi:hypothetical protein D3C77_622720 [compost metagenome]